MAHTQKVWEAGTNTLVVTVPKSEKEIQNIEVGDYVEVSFKLIKKNTVKKTTKKSEFIIDKT
jgi:hypothetical protein